MSGLKLEVVGCKTMRDGVIVSAIFLFFAISLILLGRLVIADLAYVSGLILALGVVLLLFAPLILIATYLKTVRKANAAD